MKNVVSKLALSTAVAAVSFGTGAAELEEVLVTAQKRTESLQDVPNIGDRDQRRANSGCLD